jgi:CRISPR-associated protein Cas5t
MRNFEHIPVKLFEGGSFPFCFGKPFEFICDEKEEKEEKGEKGSIPLFFAKMVYPGG